MLADLRDALRQLRKAPGFALTAIITLALGIGATTAIFTLVHQVMLKSLPVVKPEELWRIGDKIRCCNWGGYVQGSDGNLSLFSWMGGTSMIGNGQGEAEIPLDLAEGVLPTGKA
jgi:putative ABC transport system permease protein